MVVINISLISVIVPVYKVENVLHYCIDSILNQTYKDFELILVDDGSPDNSGKICDEYAQKDNLIKVIHKENGGVSSARNCGIDAAKGKYICFVDSDDTLQSTYLSELLSQMRNDIHFALCCYNKVYADKRIEKNLIENQSEYFSFNKNDIMTINKFVIMSQPWNKIFDRSIIEEYNIRMDENLSLGEDMLFVYQYLSHIIDEQFAVVNKPLYDYTIANDGSLLTKYRENLFDEVNLLNNKMYKIVEPLHLSSREIDAFYDSCFFRYENVLRNNMRSQLSLHKRLKINRSVLGSKEFKYYLNRVSDKLNIIYRVFYGAKMYLPIYIFERIF